MNSNNNNNNNFAHLSNLAQAIHGLNSIILRTYYDCHGRHTGGGHTGGHGLL